MPFDPVVELPRPARQELAEFPIGAGQEEVAISLAHGDDGQIEANPELAIRKAPGGRIAADGCRCRTHGGRVRC